MAVICLLLQLYVLVLIARIVLSWIPSVPEPVAPLANGVRTLTDPVLEPVRRVLPPLRIGMAALDLSPIIVFIGIQILSGILCR